ncbi:MAG: adenosine deaminase [Gammaproteobacteria bacterium]|nr:MAG: adenosine deaminase [Gammaproteobacteria bacterium]
MTLSLINPDFNHLPKMQELASKTFLASMPKAELHLHLDGALSPELMFTLAQRNKVELPYKSVAEIEAAYQFTSLQSFLDLYYQGASVLNLEQDFYDLTTDYFLKCKADNIRHTEISFDPQTHTERGIAFETIISGILRAMSDAKEKWNISSLLIMDFLRHLSEESAIKTLAEALPWKDKIIAVGLDSSELGHPPSKFTRVFEQARAEGFRVVAHAGEEGPPEYIWEAINLLKVERIDHGVRCDEDARLMEYLRTSQIPLTVCPLSNVRLCVYNNMKQHNIFKLMDAGLRVMINSDDPTYFGGYLNDNYFALADAFPLTRAQALQLAHNSFTASFISDQKKQAFVDELEAYATQFRE